MTSVVVFTLLIVLLAGGVLAYTAFPHRRNPTPGARWFDQAVERVRVAVPVIQDGELDGRRDDEREPDPVGPRGR